ncbi:MAG: sugar phosphate isomerase/epimerase [Anaerolineae bacterium]|nr:sugar phosphate isomerase/epimerase [Anaerolineae bacterium]
MTAPIAVQLYSLREDLAQDFAGTVRRVAALGYAGVEPFGNPDNLAEAAALYKELGLTVPSAHMAIPLGDNQDRTLEIAAAYGLKRVILPGLDRWETVDAVKLSCERYNEAYAFCAAHGLAFGVHNHWWEFLPLDEAGTAGFDILIEELDPHIFFEVDTYWVQVGGRDPVKTVADLGARAPLLHIKDGPANREEAMVAVGDGVLDVPAIIQAGGDHTEWLVVELDRCDTDMAAAVAQSYTYLVEHGLGRGK